MCESELAGLGPVDIDVQRWIVIRLLDTQIHGSGDRPELLQKVVGDHPGGIGIGPDTCTSMGLGSPKLECLRDDVSRQEGEARGRKAARQHGTQLPDVAVAGMVIRLQAMNMSASPGPTGAEVL